MDVTNVILFTGILFAVDGAIVIASTFPIFAKLIKDRSWK